LAWYAEVEFQDFITYADKQAPLARHRLDLLSTLEKSLDEYLSLTPTDKKVRSAAKIVRTAKARANSQLREIRPTKGGKPAQSWKVCFVFRLAAFWHIITGEQPPLSHDSDFAGLVSAAWNSLHPKIPEITWDSYVRRFAKWADLQEALETASIASLCVHGIWQP
jgi:hypothetical protein